MGLSLTESTLIREHKRSVAGQSFASIHLFNRHCVWEEEQDYAYLNLVFNDMNVENIQNGKEEAGKRKAHYTTGH